MNESDEDLGEEPQPPVFESKTGDEAATTVEFKIRPDLESRFKPASVKEVIYGILHDTLSGQEYDEENVEELIKSIASRVKNILEEEIFKRYKLIVNVVLGEQRGAGLSCAARCLWDHDTDSYASLSFVNVRYEVNSTDRDFMVFTHNEGRPIKDSLFCVCTVFGVYYY